MQRQKNEIIDFFQTYIFGFIFKDIKNCINARANYVVALSLLSYTEYIGGLISGNLGLRDKSKENFYAAIEYFSNEYKELDKKIEVEFTDDKGKINDKGIYAIFRCGLVHEYFIRGAKTTVNNNPYSSHTNHIGIEVHDTPTGKLLIFYTNEYFHDFQTAVDKIYKLLIVDNNPILLDGFNKSLDRLEGRKIL
ncbi:MAG: hypothetical protein Q7U68_07140 [Candidatus Roizmanbacteria bacterium]|nr:hypothetical protein [Candidatus Roizmanbacteria bacterium]